ncbi:MAG TPA: uroporphyrinogen-III synthase [Gammaproteobacteria bacterium]|nr:uroporphyrinogen-III synthase [Gammaproteobacteria bacterium]
MTAAAAPLAGRRVLITRGEDDSTDWAERIARYGGEPVLLPCIRCEPLDGPELRAAVADALAGADWLVLTSRRGVEALASLRGGPRPALPQRTKVAVVGAATAQAARAHFGRADLVGTGTGAELGALLAAALQAELDATARELGASSALCMAPSSSHVVLAVAANAGTALERALESAHARCTRLDVYRTIPAEPAARKRALSSLGADNVLLASPSAVTGFVHQVQVDAPAAIYTIGPSTTAAARAEGLAVTAEAREPSLEGLLEAMQCAR